MNNRVFYSEFLAFMVESGALLFGEFTLKSGRKSPYFINTGEYCTGEQMLKLGDFYAKLVKHSVLHSENADAFDARLNACTKEEMNRAVKSKFNVLFGPAYKGIPLVTTLSSRLAGDGINLNVSYDRKEKKDHGEGKRILGYYPKDGDRIAIIEDVTTAGTSVREVIALLDEYKIDAKVVALYVSIDRTEQGVGTEKISATAQLSRDFGIEVYSIATTADIIDYLENTPAGCVGIPDADKYAAKMKEYLKQYGV
ncbi:MAG: orotate phosphoribosyltransferase [Oscillospiraceae bacterium]|nr:orotate phosphoribosyltransferase [Oscillospiraceae bacterium]